MIMAALTVEKILSLYGKKVNIFVRINSLKPSLAPQVPPKEERAYLSKPEPTITKNNVLEERFKAVEKGIS